MQGDVSSAGVPSSRLDLTFAALADPTRRAILALLTSRDASVAELTAPFAMSQPAISKHLKVLERAGLISRGRDAQRRPCRLVASPLAEAHGWLEGYRVCWERAENSGAARDAAAPASAARGAGEEADVEGEGDGAQRRGLRGRGGAARRFSRGSRPAGGRSRRDRSRRAR